MDNRNIGTTEDLEDKDNLDPWTAAFAALEQRGKEDGEGTAASNDNSVSNVNQGAESNNEGDADDAGQQDSSASENNDGGLDSVPGDSEAENRDSLADLYRESDVDVAKYREDTEEQVRNKAINDVAQEFIKRGYRSDNGKLGATINDKDVCIRDEDGVPHFYNPETGMEFHGENPRKQAQEWVESYNAELAEMFNKSCSEYEEWLMKQVEPSIAVLEFKPKYENLDPIRKGMFDNVIEEYEIRNDGMLVGYSCDLDKALALVDRQIAMIQNYARQQQKETEQESDASGPALDMKTSGGTGKQGKTPKSLEEAMLMLQDRQLENFK